jgi:hypothetical protein
MATLGADNDVLVRLRQRALHRARLNIVMFEQDR